MSETIMNRPIAKPLVSIIRDLSLTGQPFLSHFHAKACNNPFAAAYL